MADVKMSEFLSAPGVGDWRVLDTGACVLYRTSSFAEGAAFTKAVSEAARVAGHPPDVDLRPTSVTLRVVTQRDNYMGMSEADIEVARAVSKVAAEMGLVAEPAAVQGILLVPGAPDVASIRPFWRAVMGYVPRPDSPEEDLVDAERRGPAIWMERMKEPRGDGGGAIHVAVWVAPEVAEARVAAALAAGGRMVRDTYAPMWWTLADAAGNEVDVSTIQQRDY